MKKFFSIVVVTALYIWQLPQNLLGLLFMLFFSDEKKIISEKGVVFYVATSMNGGISLGKYIFLSKNLMLKLEVYWHEYGHTAQSKILGPLYLPTIGLCSVLHATFCRKNNYYHYWTESWANKLGGIEGYTGHGSEKDGIFVICYDKILKAYYEFIKK